MKLVLGSMLNVASVGLAVAGVLYHVEWAENLLLFMVWVATIAGTCVAFSDKSKAELRSKGPTSPRGLAATTDIITAGIFASAGHYGYAAMVVWQIACESNIYDMEAA